MMTIEDQEMTEKERRESPCDCDCDICQRGEYSWGTNGYGEVEEVFLYDCGKTEEV